MEAIGYPSIVLYLLLLVGIPLALTRPFKAFLLVSFIFAAADADAFTFTRTEFLGPYFNANDACLLIALIAMFPYAVHRTKQTQFPKVTKWIFVVLLIGFVQSWFVMGWTYEALRALRWAIKLPIYFIIAATLVDRQERVKPLLIALFLGSVVSAVEHFVFVREKLDIYGEVFTHIRSISFRSPGVFFLAAGLVWMPKMKERDKIIFIGGCILFVISILLNQTRSIWFSTVAVLPIALLLFRQKNIDLKIIILPIILIGLLIAVIVTTALIAPEINLFNMVFKRFESLEQGVATVKRAGAFALELKEWSRGTLIFGRGLSYFDNYGYSMLDLVAWGHLGHVTTLAQLGIIGLVVYSFYLPKTIINGSRKLWKQDNNEMKFLGLFAGIAMIWFWICFIMSDSFLGHHAVSGIIFGTAWRQAMLIKTDNVLTKHKSHLWSPINKIVREIAHN